MKNLYLLYFSTIVLYLALLSFAKDLTLDDLNWLISGADDQLDLGNEHYNTGVCVIYQTEALDLSTDRHTLHTVYSGPANQEFLFNGSTLATAGDMATLLQSVAVMNGRKEIYSHGATPEYREPRGTDSLAVLLSEPVAELMDKDPRLPNGHCDTLHDVTLADLAAHTAGMPDAPQHVLYSEIAEAVSGGARATDLLLSMGRAWLPCPRVSPPSYSPLDGLLIASILETVHDHAPHDDHAQPAPGVVAGAEAEAGAAAEADADATDETDTYMPYYTGVRRHVALPAGITRYSFDPTLTARLGSPISPRGRRARAHVRAVNSGWTEPSAVSMFLPATQLYASADSLAALQTMLDVATTSARDALLTLHFAAEYDPKLWSEDIREHCENSEKLDAKCVSFGVTQLGFRYIRTDFSVKPSSDDETSSPPPTPGTSGTSGTDGTDGKTGPSVCDDYAKNHFVLMYEGADPSGAVCTLWLSGDWNMTGLSDEDIEYIKDNPGRLPLPRGSRGLVCFSGQDRGEAFRFIMLLLKQECQTKFSALPDPNTAPALRRAGFFNVVIRATNDGDPNEYPYATRTIYKGISDATFDTNVTVFRSLSTQQWLLSIPSQLQNWPSSIVVRAMNTLARTGDERGVTGGMTRPSPHTFYPSLWLNALATNMESGHVGFTTAGVEYGGPIGAFDVGTEAVEGCADSTVVFAGGATYCIVKEAFHPVGVFWLELVILVSHVSIICQLVALIYILVTLGLNHWRNRYTLPSRLPIAPDVPRAGKTHVFSYSRLFSITTCACLVGSGLLYWGAGLSPVLYLLAVAPMESCYPRAAISDRLLSAQSSFARNTLTLGVTGLVICLSCVPLSVWSALRVRKAGGWLLLPSRHGQVAVVCGAGLACVCMITLLALMTT